MTSKTRNQSFVAHLSSLHDNQNREAMAVFRRSLARLPGVDITPYRFFGQFLAGQTTDTEIWLLSLVAGLYALAPEPIPTRDQEGSPSESRRTLGRSLSDACRAKQGLTKGLERRLTAMLNARRSALPVHLRHIIKLLKNEQQPIDWLQLMNDLQAWDRAGRKVQRRWAKDFWASPQATPAPSKSELTHPTEEHP